MCKCMWGITSRVLYSTLSRVVEYDVQYLIKLRHTEYECSVCC